jgi:hypothetical protein
MGVGADPIARPEAEQTGRHPYVREGIQAGVIGASIVAVFFLLIDLAAARPLATPNALGAVLFLGERADLSRSLSAPLILGYTAAHGTVFIGFASVAATLLLGSPRLELGPPIILAIGFGLFAALTIFFFALTLVTDLSAWGALGGIRVAAANALAAGGMTASLVLGVRRARISTST